MFYAAYIYFFLIKHPFIVLNKEYWDMIMTNHKLHTLKTERIIYFDVFNFAFYYWISLSFVPLLLKTKKFA